MRTKVGVIAGNYSQYRNFIHNTDQFVDVEYFYISTPDSLRGFHGDVILVGSYWENEAAHYYQYEHIKYTKSIPEWDL